MPRPKFILDEDLARWDKIISSEIPEVLTNNPLFREVAYAGQWLGERLHALNCSEEKTIRIVYTAGKLSFGRDPWDISEMLLDEYQQNKLTYEEPDYSLN